MKSDTYELLVFDWDGTLIDSIERIVTSLQHASQTALKKNITDLQARHVIGLGLAEALAILHPDESNEDIEKVAEAYKQHFLFDNPVPARLFEGVLDMLEELKDAGYQLAIATGKSRPGLQRALDEHKLHDHFVATRCAGENLSKPHPQMLDEITQATGIHKNKTVMIGDSEHDLKMALNAGVDSIAVTHGVHGEDILNKHQPLICLDHITELSNFLAHN